MVTTAMNNQITEPQKNAIRWACRWHKDFEWGLMGTTDERCVEFINARFGMHIQKLGDLNKQQARNIISSLKGGKE